MTIAIKDQQRLLLDAGFNPGIIDGYWGPNTNRAYMEWRKATLGEEAAAVDIKGIEKLDGVHPALIRVVQHAALIAPVPFQILEGVRSLRRQKQLVATGSSKTMNSRHIVAQNGYAHAVDIAPLENGEVTWNWALYYPLADAIKQAAVAEEVPIEWGGDWKSFKDGPHWQLPWNEFPGNS